MADARHIRTDMLSSLVILASLLRAGLGLAVNRHAAAVVVGFVGRSALAAFLDAVRVLLDASLDPSTLARIREVALADPRVVAFALMKGRGTAKEWLLMKKKDAFAEPAWRLEQALTPEKRKGLKVRIPPCQTS
jgi:divalent metal cation (Fe/Co/Zn/Cd) transporter